MIQSALEGIIPPDRIYGTELDYDDAGEVQSIVRVPAGYGKVAVVEELEGRFGVTPDRTIYVGDGSSDVHVMLHVNNRDGFTIAVSENRQLARIAKRTVLSDDAFSIAVPILDQLHGLGVEQDSRRCSVLRPHAARAGSARGPTGSSSATTPLGIRGPGRIE